MSVSSVTTSIISSLGNNSGSILPLFAKDAVNSLGVTYVFSKEGGKHDGKEKAIEEFGTQAIWLLGIPAVKKLIDKTVYKLAKVNPDIDIRKFKEDNADNIKNTIERFAKDSPQRKVLENALEHKKLVKGLFLGKFAVATVATLGALQALIHFKQNTTNKAIKEEVMAQKLISNGVIKALPNFTSIQEQYKQGPASFKGGVKSLLSGFMYNPVMNMSILDGGIFYKRMEQGRSAEKGEIAFKEISAIAFLYALAEPIQKGLEFLGSKISGVPLSLDYKILASKSVENSKGITESLIDGSLKKDIDSFNALARGDKKVVDFIYNNPDNMVVQMLKTSGDVQTITKPGKKILGFIPTKIATQEIDPLAFIDTGKIRKTVDNLSKMSDGVLSSSKSIKEFTKIAKGVKVVTTLANILVAAAFLGFIQPLMIIQARKHNNHGDSNNPAIREAEAEMRATFA